MQAVTLRPKDWLRLTESGIGGQLITPMMVHLLVENGNSVMGIPQEDLDQSLDEAARQIPETVVADSSVLVTGYASHRWFQRKIGFQTAL